MKLGRRDALVALSFTFVASRSRAQDAGDAAAWEKIRDDDGIAVFKRDVAGSPLLALRGDGIVNAPIGRVATVLLDTSRATEWMDSTSEARILRKISPTSEIVYTHIKTPVVMKDRDFVTQSTLVFDGGQKKVSINIRSVTDASAPATDYVRGMIFNSSFLLTQVDPGKTRLTAEIHADPKGSVAKWIVNLFQKNWPYNTIVGVRKQVSKPDVTENAEVKGLLAANGF